MSYFNSATPCPVHFLSVWVDVEGHPLVESSLQLAHISSLADYEGRAWIKVVGMDDAMRLGHTYRQVIDAIQELSPYHPFRVVSLIPEVADRINAATQENNE